MSGRRGKETASLDCCAPIGRRRGVCALVLLGLAAGTAQPARAQSVEDLRNLSIEDLANVEITSVSKRAEPLIQAPAAIYVITADDIHRSGAATLPEVLRLAPNLEVAQVNSQSYVISARGFNSVNATDKLLVLIDGRSVYTPFFSSVFWDQQQVMVDDIDRIEVISGPGGTLWGANAVNGVINIITKNSRDTQGGLVNLTYGTFDRIGAARWGGRIAPDATYRGYAMGFGERHTDLPSGASAMDEWNGKQGGFRSDFTAGGGSATVQGDIYENLIDTPAGRTNGGNMVARWTKPLEIGGAFELQGYYDRQDRSTSAGFSEQINTLDVTAQHSFNWNKRNEVVWGLGQRVSGDRFVNTANVFVLIPGSETIALTNLFAQDTFAIEPDLKLTLGSKFEYSTFSGPEYLPSIRLGWNATPSHFLWAAVSRAVKTPSRIDRNLAAPGIVNPAIDFQSESLVAYELGYRGVPAPQVSISVSVFYNQYDDIRTTSLSPTGGFPAMFQNGMEGDTWGTEIWGEYKIRPWWRLSPGFSLLRKDLHLKPGVTDVAGIQTAAGHDPGHQVFLRSYMDLPHDLALYVDVRHVGGLANVSVDPYFEADVRLGWRVSDKVELSIAGNNLVHAHHAETPTPPPLTIPRSFYANIRLFF